MSEPFADTGGYRTALRTWLREAAPSLEPYRRHPDGPMLEVFRHELELVALLGNAGWSRYGWPPDAGGLGGSPALRAVLYDELSAAGVVLPEAYLLLETLGPALVHFAPHIARRELPAFLEGHTVWSQGFSEPDAGSDLASLRTRAIPDGDGWRLSGQKTWVSFATATQRAMVLARTGTPESRHRGLTMFWVDLERRECDVRGIRAETGRDEFGELFFDDVPLSRDDVIGDIGGGWSVAMFLLQFERGMYAWQRQAYMLATIDELLARPEICAGASYEALGEAFLATSALRHRCRTTVEALARGETVGPRTSVDKLLLAAAEQAVFDRLEAAMRAPFLVGADDPDLAWRTRWFFARAGSIYGGAAEVQRDIVAEHLLGLHQEDRRGR